MNLSKNIKIPVDEIKLKVKSVSDIIKQCTGEDYDAEAQVAKEFEPPSSLSESESESEEEEEEDPINIDTKSSSKADQPEDLVI